VICFTLHIHLSTFKGAENVVREKILDILTDICGTDEIKRNPELELFKNGWLDSFGIIELFVAIHEQLDIEVAPTEMEREEWDTANKIIAYLEERQAK
jgi:D-alanine--poly(phosphoribitol) ligase subunit 2